jgi:hypothetical protein
MYRMQRTARLLAVTTLAVAASVGAARGGEKITQNRIKQLIAKLGAESWPARESAEKELLSVGLPALAAVKAVLESKDAEVRERAARLYQRLKPLADLISSRRTEQLAAATKVCDRAGDIAKTDPAASLPIFRAAFKVNPRLLDNSFIRSRMKKLATELPLNERAAYFKSAIWLYVSDRHDELQNQFPASELTGQVLYAAGEHEKYLKSFPNGFYAPNVEYLRIAGYKRYAMSQRSGRGLKITNPDKEIEAWPGFLRKYPDFEGADDANYRYARALEIKGDLLEAAMRLRLSLGDGDMMRQSRERLLFIMDAKMDASKLKELQAAAAKDKTSPEKLLITGRELPPLGRYLAAVKLLREGKWKEAGKAFRKATKVPEGRITGLLKAINNNALRRAVFAEATAKLAKEAGDGDGLYKLASHIYKQGRWMFMVDLFYLRGVGAYKTATEPAGFFRTRSRFWQAERIYRQVVKEHPKSASRPKAMYMLGCCHCHMVDHTFSAFWRPRKKAHVKESVLWFRRVTKEYPDHELAPPARKAADILVRQWKIRE